jgi:predicted enzyme related to lactoylglutathione lyase
MHDRWKACATPLGATAVLAASLLPALAPRTARGQAFPAAVAAAGDAGVAVGPQYDSTHVYVAPSDLDAFVASVVATFGGQPAKPSVANVLPVPSNTVLQALPSPVGMFSIFAFQTPIPFPFGQERTGYLVTDLDQAVKEARADGAEVIVAPWKDPIGMDAVIQWPGGVKMQLYWHFTPPSSPPLATIPDNRVYVSPDAADASVNDFVRFAHGKVISDDAHADAGEIGRPGETYRRVRITSTFGNMQVLVTDGHLPYPFGHEVTGYQVQDLSATLAKATAAGAKLLSPPYKLSDRSTAIVEFPGGFIAEVHSVAAQ